MASKEDIITLPHPSLREESDTVDEINEDVQQLIKQMESATLDWEASRNHETGVALAAVQINDLRRVVIVRRDTGDDANQEFDIYINPEITKYDGEPKAELEGCLSVVDVYGRVPRYPKVKIKAQNIHGKTIKLFARGFLARIFQHEIDHTHGVTFVDRLGPDGELYKIVDGEMKPLPMNESTKLIEGYGVDGKI